MLNTVIEFKTFIRPHLIDADRQTVFFAETAHINTFEGVVACVQTITKL